MMTNMITENYTLRIYTGNELMKFIYMDDNHCLTGENRAVRVL